MHRPKTCSQNGQSVEMPENEKIFQQQILPAPSSVTEITPDRLLEQVQEKGWRHPPFQYMSVFALPFFDTHMFPFARFRSFSAWAVQPFLFLMSEGFLDGSAICLYIASACVGVYSKGEFVRIEVDRYTDFSDIKEKGISACRQYFLSCTLNKAWIGLVCILTSLAFSLLYLNTSYSCERLRVPLPAQCACCRTSNIQTTKLWQTWKSNPNFELF